MRTLDITHANRQSVALVALLAAFAGSASAVDPAPEYAVVRIGETLAPSHVSFATSVSEDGDAVGEIWFNGYRQSFVYTYEHGPVLLPFVNGRANCRAFDVSDRDADGDITIVGAISDSFYDETGIAACWKYATATNQILQASEIAGLPGATVTRLSAVNNSGLAVGYSRSGLGTLEPMVVDTGTGVATPLVFPVAPVDINNLGQIVGGRYLGDLQGQAVDLGLPPGASSVTLTGISDSGWVVGTAGMPFTDGAGRFVNGMARYQTTWQLLYANSAFDTGNGINDHGDAVGSIGASGAIRPAVYLSDRNELHLVENLIAPAYPVFVERAFAINAAGQIAGGNQAVLLTPLGTMIIPGDVNGDTVVDLDDLCVWRAAPIDLDQDGDADADDEQWLRDRLVSLGFVVADCNANGGPDRCDIADGISNDCNGNDVPDECEADCDSDGLPDACESDCNGNGTPDDCDIALGLSEDCNGNGIPDECDGSDAVTAALVYDPPRLLIADTTHVDDVFVSTSGTTVDVDVTLDLDYRIGNLIVRLSHAGTTVTLIDQPGHPANPSGNGQLGYRITLDDEGSGANIENVGNFGSPFEPIESPPSYRPHEPLSAFDGLPREGTWTLAVETIGPGTHFDPKLLSWSVRVTDEAVEVGICDCNANGIADDIDIASETSTDANGNGIPDECETVPGDADGDGDVDLSDLAILLANFGCTGGGCPGDVDLDGDTDLADVAIVLANYGS